MGRLADPAGSGAYDDVRLALLDALVTAKGAGRLEHAAWQEAFEGAARSLRMRVVGDAEAALHAAAAHSRFPATRLRRLLPDAEAADALLQRLLAEGMPLEQLERANADSSAHRTRALAIAAGWEAGVRVARSDAARWRALADEVARWRRPMGRFWAGSVVVALLALLLAAWLGGQLPSPHWFAPVRDAFWRLPWP